MTAKVSGYLALKGFVVLVGALALILTTAGVALARIDEFGGASFSVAYAPYTAGPVVREEIRPYAPYTAGPVVREEPRPYAPYTAGPVVPEVSRPYAPYTAGPVVPSSELPYAPYTAGPVVPEEGPTFDRLGHHLFR